MEFVPAILAALLVLPAFLEPELCAGQEETAAPLVSESVVAPSSHPSSTRVKIPVPRISYSPARIYRHPSGVSSVAFRPDGKILAVGDAKGRVWFWPVGSDEVSRSIQAHRKAVSSLLFSPSGMELITGGRDDMVKVWDLKTMKSQAWMDKRHRDIVTAVGFTPGGSLVLSASKDGSIWARDVVTGARRVAYFGHSAEIVGFGVAPEELCVISGSADRSLQSWSLETGEQVDFASQRAKVSALALAPDGRMIAVGMVDGVIELRRTDGCSVHAVALRFSKHTRAVRALAFTGDGKWLYSAGDDQIVYLWNLDSGRPVEAFQGHEGPIVALALSPGDVWLATASGDGTVRFWRRAAPPAGANPPRPSVLSDSTGETPSSATAKEIPDESPLSSTAGDKRGADSEAPDADR